MLNCCYDEWYPSIGTHSWFISGWRFTGELTQSADEFFFRSLDRLNVLRFSHVLEQRQET